MFFEQFNEFDSLEEETEQIEVLQQFNYRDLEGLFSPPRSYTRALQDYAMTQDNIISSMEQKIYDLEHKLARTGNQFYQKDAGKWGKEWTNINIEFGKLQREKIESEARLQAERIAAEARLQAEIDRLKYLNEQLQTELEVMEARLQGMVAIEVVDNKPKRALPERDSSGRFSAPVKSREEITMEYHDKGYRNTEIAQLMGVTPETVARYLKNFAKKQERAYQARIETAQQSSLTSDTLALQTLENCGFGFFRD